VPSYSSEDGDDGPILCQICPRVSRRADSPCISEAEEFQSRLEGFLFGLETDAYNPRRYVLDCLTFESCPRRMSTLPPLGLRVDNEPCDVGR
jgi:hypothetical protein